MLTAILSTAISVIIFWTSRTENLIATLPDQIAYTLIGAMVGIGFGVIVAILMGYKSKSRTVWSKLFGIKL